VGVLVRCFRWVVVGKKDGGDEKKGKDDEDVVNPGDVVTSM